MSNDECAICGKYLSSLNTTSLVGYRMHHECYNFYIYTYLADWLEERIASAKRRHEEAQ